MDTSTSEIYKAMFIGYPDVLDVKQVSKLLGVSTKTVYKLIGAGMLDSMKVGREFRVPKANLMRYLKLFDGGAGISPKS